MKFIPVMNLPQDANIHPFVQLYIQLSMKHHASAFLISLDNPTLVAATPGLIFVKRQVRADKMKPKVDEEELLQANPYYAHVRYPDGTETTVAKPSCYNLFYHLDML